MPLPWLIGAVAIASTAAARALVEEKSKEQVRNELKVLDVPTPKLAKAVSTHGALPIASGAALLGNLSSSASQMTAQTEEVERFCEEETPFVELGQRVATTRKLLGLNQDACAKAANVSRTALRNLESGKDTKLSTLFAVSGAINVPVVALIQEMQPMLEERFWEKVKSQS